VQVYLFANKAQNQEALTDATVQFLGVFRTDKRVSLGKPLVFALGSGDKEGIC
jgi:hypothetical protein